MKIIKFKLEIDVSNGDQTRALNTLLRAIGGQEKSEQVGEVLETVEEKIEKPKKKRRTQAEIKAEKEAAQTEESQDTEGAGSTEEKVPEMTEVRALFAKKLQEGTEETRTVCIAKLKELGAKNLPSLKQEDYQTFIDYLNTL